MSKDSFKTFARSYPELATTVLSGKATWQQLYELYEIYGDNNPVWNNYITKAATTTASSTSLKDLFDYLKNVDLSSLQEGITNIQKTIGLIQNLGFSKEKYEPKPIYKRFED